MIHVAVLAGGTSAEREVSLRSATAVVAALEFGGYAVTQIDPAQQDAAQLFAELKDIDVVFPVLHGAGGEDGTVQAWLESYRIPYTGAGSAVSALCFDKARYKEALAAMGMPVPRGELVRAGTIWDSPLVQQPYVLKPYDGGSSVDTFIIRGPEFADKQAIEAALARYDLMLLEELIEGQEITVGVLGSEVLPVVEIVPPSDGEFDYENKYNGKTLELCPPQHVDADVQTEAQNFALYIHNSLQIRDISRTDMIIRYSDNAIFILETNTLPGMTDQSLFPKAAAVAGHGMIDLVDMLVQDALARSTRKGFKT